MQQVERHDVTTPRPAPADANYGSDKAGMVCGYAFRPGEAGREIDSDAVAEWLAAPGNDEFLWLHFNLANSAASRWIEQHLVVPEAFREAVGANPSTRVEIADDFLVAVVNDVLFYAFDASSASTMTLCVQQRVLVSARITPLRSVDRLRAAVKRGEAFRSTVGLVAHLLRDQADVLVQIVRDATSEVDTIEDRLMGQRVLASRAKLGSLRRTLVRLQRLLAPEPAALFRLLNRPPAWTSMDDVRDLRQAAEELAAAVADSVALVERVRLLQEELVALVNEQTSRTLFVLTIVTVVALPMTIIPGFFGMNVGGVPLAHSVYGFWAVVVLVASVVLAGALLAFSRRDRP
jgi:zinc transporter